MSLGYGQTAPYGELEYKGYDYPDEESYTDIAISNMIEQYRKSYINSSTSTSIVISSDIPIVTNYKDYAVSLIFEQYKEDYLN